MTYSQEWNTIYAEGKQLNRWPFTDLVALCNRHIPDLAGKRVLELGCGSGCNARFFSDEGADYLGIDGANFPAWDFTIDIPPGPFDLIFDRAAVTHNDTESIKRCLKLVYDALKPGGLYIAVDWFSKSHSSADMGDVVDDYTRTNITEGQFKGVGMVHFSDMPHLQELFSRFTMLSYEHKLVTRGDGSRVGTYNFVVRKPE